MKKALTALLFLAVGRGDIASGETGATNSITSEMDLSNVIARLNKPDTACDARRSLIKFSGLNLYEGSWFLCTKDSKMDNLRREAAKALRSHRNIETVQQALDDEDRDVRFWGVMVFETACGRTASWEPLVPRLMKLAGEDSDAGIRGEAFRRLRSYERGRTFIHALQESTKESEPFVLMMLFEFDSLQPDARAKYYTRAIEFLSGTNETLRSHWLCYVYSNVSNPSTAPMWRIEAAPGLISKLKEIRRTGLPTDAETAGKALDALLRETKTTAQQGAAPAAAGAASVER